MRPLTSSRPKGMLPIANKPILEHIVDAIKIAGINEFIFVVGYKDLAIRHYFGDGERFGIDIKYVNQMHQLGTGHALSMVGKYIDDTFFVINGDSLVNGEDIKKMIQLHAPCVGIAKHENAENYGSVMLNHDFTVFHLIEKSSVPSTNLVNAGVYLFDVDIFKKIYDLKISPRGEYEITDALKEYIANPMLYAFSLKFWNDIGTPWQLLGANELLLKNIDGPIIGKNCIIHDTADIEKNVIIGDNCEIGRNAIIRGNTAIGNGCHIKSSEIKNSILFGDVKVPHYSYIGDSIVGVGCNFGAGTKIANLRFDNVPVKVAGVSTQRRKFGAIIGDNVQIGINSSIDAGTVIGSNVRVYPHTYVSGVVPDGTSYR